MKAGAHDYIMKGNLARLVPAVDRELRESAERKERRKAEEALRAREEQLRIAREVQQQLFPPATPAITGFDIAGASYPAEATGGDYFDYFPMMDDYVGVVIGDVSGHGLGPTLLMVETRACLRTLTLMSADVSSILMRTNHRLTEDFANEQFVTLILARLEPRTRSFVYTSAGHMAGYVLDHAGALKTELMSTSYPLGVDLGFDFPAAPPLTLQPGEIVLLLTDGVVDARSPDSSVFGVERALNVVRANRSRPAREVVEALYRAVREFSQNASQHDDITAVVVKVNESGA